MDIGGYYKEANIANFFQAIHKVYICNINLISRMMFSVAKVFIQKKFVERIELLGDPSVLLNHFDSSCLLKEYGGEAEYDEKEF